MALSPRARVLLIVATILLGLTALIWYLSSKPSATPVQPISPPTTTSELSGPATNAGNTNALATPAPSSTTAAPSPAAQQASPTASAPAEATHAGGGTSSTTSGLLIPVLGHSPDDLQDTYTQSRSEGRTHNAIDIMAARNTPVVAATDGRIVKLFQSERGGITIYQLGTDERTVYYYAHLERYADGLSENRSVRRGELLGYVGDSGNAGRDNCHLHFSIWRIDDPKHFWDGENVNPYPLLTKR
ncbi:MAG TPA: M23 family metallopeptidase [Pyrinomonadaceae bacterium]|nr:M23 family metallopeptidase [Pyrinomonadaceae bacterium]